MYVGRDALARNETDNRLMVAYVCLHVVSDTFRMVGGLRPLSSTSTPCMI